MTNQIKKTAKAEMAPWNCRGMGAHYSPARYGVFVGTEQIGYIWNDEGTWLVSRMSHKVAGYFPQFKGGLKAAKAWAAARLTK